MKINKIVIIFICLIILSSGLFGQDNDKKIVWIFLKPQYIEKNQVNKIQYSDEKLLKLQRNNWEENYSDYYPSDKIRIDLSKNGVKIRHYSRSLCAYSAEIKSGDERAILALPYVKSVKPVGIRTKSRIDLSTDFPRRFLSKTTEFYGKSLTQLEQLNIVKVHELGFTGKNVRIAVIDAGFRKDHLSFDYLRENGRLIDEYDFIYNDNNTQDEIPADTTYNGNQHNHGTAVLSCIVGYVPNTLIAPAFDAEILLAKTEVEGSETRIEEDNFVAAIEWAEENGADIISSSLGYRDFDNFEYSFTQLDGNTAVTTQAVNWVFNRGVLMVTAAGNDAAYFSDGGIITPGDAWGALTVGAVDVRGNLASFSSYGPTYDGRQKPEVCACGYSTWVASAYKTDTYRNSNGTSFSTPLMAGACALILQKFPYWTPSQVMENLKEFSNRSDLPDRKFGWGVPDIYRLMTETTDTAIVDITIDDKIVIAPNPVRNDVKFYFKWENPNLTVKNNYRISIYDILGNQVYSQRLIGKNIGSLDYVYWNLKNNVGKKVSSGIYLVEITGQKMNKLKKFTVLK